MAGARAAGAAMATSRAPGWRAVVALLAVCGLLIPGQLYVAIPLGAPMVEAVGASSTMASWMTGGFAVAYALGFLVFGVASDRIGRRPVLVGGAVALAATTVLVPLAPTFATLLALRVLQGLAAATFAPAALAYVVEVAPADRRLPALACVTTGLISAALVGQAYGEILEPLWGYRGAFAAAAVAYAACALVLAWLVAPARRAPAGGSVRDAYRAMAALARQPPLRTMFLCGLAVFGTFVALSTVLRLRLTETFGLSHAQVVAVELASLAGVALSPFANALSGRFGAKRVIVAAFSTAALATGLEAVAPSAIVLAAASVVFVAGIAVVNPALVGLISALAPQARGSAVAFNTFMLFCGATLGAFVPDLLGDGAVYALVGTALATAAVAIARAVPTRLGVP